MITGASRGIGRGIAVELAKRGWDLLVNYVSNEAAARGTIQECQVAAEQQGHRISAVCFRADVGDCRDREALLAEAKGRFARLDLLVNNAGIAPSTRTDLLEASEESFDRVMRTNVKGPYFLTQAVARWMIERLEELAVRETYRPKIVTVTSISAYTASTNRGEYCMAKAALSMLTPLYATRLADHGIQVFEIRPGIIATDMTDPVKQKYDHLIAEGLTPIRRWGQPEDVARAVAAIADDYLPFSTGEVVNVDGGFHLRRL